MNLLPNMVILDFCEWLLKKTKEETNSQVSDIFELIFNEKNYPHLLNYAGKYINEDNMLYRKILHDFIDSEEFSECLKQRTDLLRKRQRHHKFDRRMLQYLVHDLAYCLRYCEYEDNFIKYLEKLISSNELYGLGEPINPHDLAQSIQIVMENKYNDNNYNTLNYLVNITDLDLSTEINFLEWLLKNNTQKANLEKMPLAVFKSIVDEYCLSQNKLNEKSKIIKSFKQSSFPTLSKKLTAFLTKSQLEKMKSLGYIYDRYANEDIPYRCIFLTLNAEAEDFKKFINRYWSDLHHMSANCLDIYYSEDELEKSGYETKRSISSLSNIKINSIPCILIWEKDIQKAEVLEIGALQYDRIFKLLEKIVKMIESNNTFENIVESARDFIKIDNTNIVDLKLILTEIRDAVISCKLSQNDSKTIDKNIDTIQREIASETPQKSLIEDAINDLKSINGSLQFSAAVATLIQFVQPFLR